MATLEQIQDKMKQLQARADAMVAKQAQKVVDQIRRLMLEHGLTTADIEARAKAKREGTKTAARKTSKAKAPTTAKPVSGKLPAKYRDSKTGATWSGKARPPKWIANVKDRSKFLIENAGIVTIDVGSTKSAVRKALKTSGATARKGQLQGKQPAQYLNAKTGATWSGRGRAPAWLANVRDRTKFLIDANSTAADARVASAPKAARKSPSAAKKTVAKKAAIKKVPARKLAAKKAPRPKANVAKKAIVKAQVAAEPETVVAHS
jgi:DNA-binding protein H-NS